MAFSVGIMWQRMSCIQDMLRAAGLAMDKAA
jgi:hypothetical protein